ncbi:hypothetical protein DFH07DRAFT_984646 [Mycena maculata]|uniref:DUF7788 domain-containing protein n=1 Tax=Mycena maculata TaxID=230809 RepID=A0AAD7NUM8_9AGAR|nr:hypothetical protein DFH07DRAFT_984646 [Mycena maculata]
MNTNAVFLRLELILPLAIQHKVRPEDMIKRVFVFSDTHTQAAGAWETNYDVIARAFGKAGYEVPKNIPLPLLWIMGTPGSSFALT